MSAKDKGTGKEQQIRIQASGGLSDDDIEKMVKDAEANAEEDKKRRELVETRNQAEGAAHSAESQLKEHGDKIDAADKTAIEDAVKAVKTAAEGEDVAAIKAALETLQQASMKLGEAVYKDQAADAGAGAEGAEEATTAADDDVVDADFEEVDDDKK